MSKLVEEFVSTTLEFSPVTATGVGFHRKNSVVLDELLDDYDEVSLRNQRQYYADFRERLSKVDTASLSTEDRADYEILRNQTEYQLLEFDTIQSYKHNPTLYVELVGKALFDPFVLQYAPAEERYKHIASRLLKVPQLFGQARQNLVDAPELWTDVAIRENDGNHDLIVKVLLAQAPKGWDRRLDRPAQEAISAISAFTQWMNTTLREKKSDWRLGSDRYKAKFALGLGLGQTPEQVLADAEAELKRVRSEMADIASKLEPRSGDSDPDRTIRAALDRIALRHAKRETYFADAERDLEEVRQFVREKGFVPMPARDNLKVIETPVFMRGIYSVGGFNPAPPLEPQLGAFYWLTPIEEAMDADRAESKLREYNFYGLKILTIHEAMPGHYLQFEFANDVLPQSRRVLRSVFANGPNVEGWAVYATDLMVEHGYQGNDPAFRLTWLKQYLRAVANTILDVRLHTMGMTDDDAMSLMTQQTFQEKEEATAKLRRAKLSSVQLPTYFTGYRAWKRLRAKAEKAPGFREIEFHRKALAAGAAPMPALEAIVMGADTDAR
ncbi:MAG: DUF885 domain-containing protein [Bryobacteraceae bacterium]